MNRTRYIPSIVMLAAAFVACVSTIYFGYTTKQILLIVLAVSVIFLVLGLVIKFFAEKYLVVSTKIETSQDQTEQETEENAENTSENQENANANEDAQ